MSARRVTHLFSSLLAVALVACGGDDSAPAPPITFDLDVDVPVGAELHTCQFVRMPETGSEIFVDGGSYTTTDGTHHFLLFRTAPDMPPQQMNVPLDCYEGDGAMKYERGYVSGGMLREEAAEFPAGLGLPFASGEILLMQGHFLDTSSVPEHATVHVELTTVEASTILARVGTFRFYDPFIYLPPHGRASAAMRCHVHEDVTLISAGSHMHGRGVGYRAFADLPGASASTTPFYTTDDWQHPTPWIGDMPLAAGSSLRFGCDYDNPSDTAITQGLSADDNEMCMLSGFYFPAQDAEEEQCTSMDMHGTGTRTCAQTTSCLSLCPAADLPDFSPGHADVGPCWQQCIVDSCPNVTGVLFPELTCVEDHCKEACATPGTACSQCVEVSCKAELDACQALGCDD